MDALTMTGFLLWTAHSVAQGQWPLILTNAVCFVFAAFVLITTLLPSRQPAAVADGIDSHD